MMGCNLGIFLYHLYNNDIYKICYKLFNNYNAQNVRLFQSYFALQTNVQDEDIPLNSPKNKQYQSNSEYHNHPSPKLSHTGHSGKESNSKQDKEIAGKWDKYFSS